MNKPTAARLLPLAALLVLGLAACSWHGPSPSANRSAASPKAMAACSQHADQVYDMQNRAEIYRNDIAAGGQRDAPFAAGGLPSNPSNGLTARYTRETMLDDCLNGLSVVPADTGTTVTAPAPPPPRR